MTGMRYTPLTVDPRDLSPDDQAKTNPDGAGEYAVTFHIPGLIERPEAVRLARVEIDKAVIRHGDGPTCGLFHDRDVLPHELPHTGRAEINLFLRRVRKRYGRPALLIQVWTHFGSCDEARGPR